MPRQKSELPAGWADIRHADRIGIKRVACRFAEHEQFAVRDRGPIFGTVRPSKSLVPNNLGAKQPALILERQNDQGRDHEQRLRGPY